MANTNSSHHATCAECSVKFELPFVPTNDKPVYCNDCFRNKKNQGRGDYRRGSDNRNREMFSAVCDKCGSKCEVPFRPSGGKPIFCDNCFTKNKNNAPRGNNQGGRNQMQELNTKLDTLIDALVAAKIIKMPKVEKPKPVKEIKETPVKAKAPVKKAPAKKKPTAKKKAPAKKTPVKKKAPAKKKAAPKKKK
jgi:CxxC-x17-CxxC domain-containing protein